MISSLIMAFAIWHLLVFNIFVILPVAMLVYLGATTLLGTIPREDLKALYTAMRHKAQRTSPVPLDNQQEMEPEEMQSVDTTFYADEDTVPMKAIYGRMRHKAQ